jgi:hypothetical protein
MSEQVLFSEKQYLGSNRYSILRRLVLALFCFVAYYWSENPKPVEVSGITIGAYPVADIPNSGQLFFVMGVAILVLSSLLVFVLHIHTKVTDSSVIIDGLWTSRKVKIDLKNIVSVKTIRYSRYFFKRPVYNLHYKGRIRFFTSGSEAVELVDKDGLVYRIGSQRASELEAVIQRQLGNS